MSDLREELARVVKLLVDHPDQVRVEERRDSQPIAFRIEVAPDDLGQVIGRQGRTARALRSLLAERSSRDGERYELEIVEP